MKSVRRSYTVTCNAMNFIAVLGLILVSLLPVAVAEPPSFDCAKANTPDELLICADPELAANDLETARLYKAIRQADKTLASSISRKFINDRRKCRDSRICIFNTQQRAKLLYQSALSGLSANVSEMQKNDSVGMTATQIGKQDSRTVDNAKLRHPIDKRPNPWPEAFARRTYQLGISIDQFQATKYPDSDVNGETYAVCSDDQRNTENYYPDLQITSERLLSAGIVVCKFFQDIEITEEMKRPVTSGLGLADLQLVTAFCFLPDEQQVLRLFWINTSGPTEQFEHLLPILEKAYGPAKIRTETWQNKLGNKFEGIIATWGNGVSEIEFRQYGDTTRSFEINHKLLSLWTLLNKAFEAMDVEAAKKL